MLTYIHNKFALAVTKQKNWLKERGNWVIVPWRRNGEGGGRGGAGGGEGDERGWQRENVWLLLLSYSTAAWSANRTARGDEAKLCLMLMIPFCFSLSSLNKPSFQSNKTNKATVFIYLFTIYFFKNAFPHSAFLIIILFFFFEIFDICVRTHPNFIKLNKTLIFKKRFFF